MKNKPLKKQLSAQFYRRNIPVLCVAVFGALVSGSLNLILSWIMQQLIDAASGVPGALAIGTLAKISGGFVLLCVAAFLLDYISQPRFIERAMRQYKDFAFQKLMEDGYGLWTPMIPLLPTFCRRYHICWIHHTRLLLLDLSCAIPMDERLPIVRCH